MRLCNKCGTWHFVVPPKCSCGAELKPSGSVTIPSGFPAIGTIHSCCPDAGVFPNAAPGTVHTTTREVE